MNYVEKLEALDKEKSSKLIANGSKIHAQALIKQFIKGAEEKINIVSKDLSIYDDKSIRELLESAFAREVKLRLFWMVMKYLKITNFYNCVWKMKNFVK